MGCGKSSVGRRLSALTGHRFVDTDDLITAAEGKSISEIFAENGEEYFREVEQRVVQAEVGIWGIVLSTGGGLILREANRKALKSIGVVGWLDADEAILYERASRSGKRPLLHNENPEETFHRLLESRRALYEEVADFRLDATELDHDQAAQSFLEEAMRHRERFEY